MAFFCVHFKELNCYIFWTPVFTGVTTVYESIKLNDERIKHERLGV